MEFDAESRDQKMTILRTSTVETFNNLKDKIDEYYPYYRERLHVLLIIFIQATILNEC